VRPTLMQAKLIVNMITPNIITKVKDEIKEPVEADKESLQSILERKLKKRDAVSEAGFKIQELQLNSPGEYKYGTSSKNKVKNKNKNKRSAKASLKSEKSLHIRSRK
jgi:hypothetical protein